MNLQFVVNKQEKEKNKISWTVTTTLLIQECVELFTVKQPYMYAIDSPHVKAQSPNLFFLFSTSGKRWNNSPQSDEMSKPIMLITKET